MYYTYVKPNKKG